MGKGRRHRKSKSFTTTTSKGVPKATTGETKDSTVIPVISDEGKMDGEETTSPVITSEETQGHDTETTKQVRISERENKGRMPDRYADYVMNSQLNDIESDDPGDNHVTSSFDKSIDAKINELVTFSQLKQQECEYLRNQLRKMLDEFEQAKGRENAAVERLNVMTNEMIDMKKEIDILRYDQIDDRGKLPIMTPIMSSTKVDYGNQSWIKNRTVETNPSLTTNNGMNEDKWSMTSYYSNASSSRSALLRNKYKEEMDLMEKLKADEKMRSLEMERLQQEKERIRAELINENKTADEKRFDHFPFNSDMSNADRNSPFDDRAGDFSDYDEDNVDNNLIANNSGKADNKKQKVKFQFNSLYKESEPLGLPNESSSADNLAAAMMKVLSNQNSATKTFVSRQGKAAELPTFTGNPLDWPLFHHHYKQSTEDCSFTPMENSSRLEKAVQGEAKACVRALMIIPGNCNEVIRRLKQRYGRPEYIVQALIESAKNTPSPREGRLSDILDYSNAISNLVITVQALEEPAHLQNPQLIKELVDKLPDSLKLQWGESAMMKHHVTLVDFEDWIDNKANAASIVSIPSFLSGKKKKASDNVVGAVNDKTEKKCQYCNKDGHRIGGCSEFKNFSTDDRWAAVKNKGLCIACLCYGHLIKSDKCLRKDKDCGVEGCIRQHHPLLHSKQKLKFERPFELQKLEIETTDKKLSAPGELFGHASNTSSRSVLLRVVPIKLYGPRGEATVNAFFDDGSTVTMITANLADRLGLKGRIDPLRIKWTNNKFQEDNSSMRVSCKAQAICGGQKYTLRDVRTFQNLSIPAQPINYGKMREQWTHLESVDFPNINNSQPEILIGSPHIDLTVAREVIQGKHDAPILTRTKLGWVVHGPLQGNSTDEFAFPCFHECDDDIIQNLVKESFTLEGIGITNYASNRSSQDATAEKKMDLITSRVGDRWETGLLWRSENMKLPPSQPVAIRRLVSLERRFSREPELAKEYKEKVEHYINSGYARKLSPEEALMKTDRQWYLPHFPTTHPNKPGKIRLVFDAACKSYGYSLNDYLLTGPDLLVSLPGVLLKFRERKIAFTGDITEMFHQVKICKQDRHAQRFLWRNNPMKPIDVYELEVMMFGAVCSPYCAQYVKNRNTIEFADHFPDAVAAITDKHYMDDYLDSCDSTEEAFKLIQDVKTVHLKGGFEIGKWVSNCPKLMKLLTQHQPKAEKLESKDFTEWTEVKTERVLGLHWDPASDQFTYRVNLKRAGEGVAEGSKHPTKREILRLLMLIFDPLGFILHFTIKGRIIMQEVWKSKIGWDDEVPREILKAWRKWISELAQISDIRIPRCYSQKLATSQDIQLHVFTDASESAYAAVAYLRIVTTAEVEVSLVMTKGRVTPLKPISIPRLELQAALIASRIGKFLMDQLNLKPHALYYWSDSQTVLKWIRSDARRYQQYVANRVGEIHENSEVATWRWIPTKLNPADDATRTGKTDFSSSSRWMWGPGFLKGEPSSWPTEPKTEMTDEDMNLETKKNFVGAIIVTPSVSVPDVQRFSSFQRLKRVMAKVLQCIEIWKSKINGNSRNLNELNLDRAEMFLHKQSQWDAFHMEMDLLTKSLPVPKDSRLFQLSPFIDKNGILKMNSRLVNAEVECLRQPIILDDKHSLTKLLIKHFHLKFNHQGQEIVKNELRQKYWIPNIRAAVRRAWSECNYCKKIIARPYPPYMGALPGYRVVQQSRPFTIVGMDYFGPMEVTVKRSREKRYGVLFTCLTTRSIHLELARNLTTDACIMAIRRMIGRRGFPKELYSDNGTNLRGADKELRETVQEIDQSLMTGNLQNYGISWKFVPPSTPHFAGSWERMVKAVKVALSVVLKSRAPHEDILQTLLVEIEAIVNSRPLTDIPVDIEALEALTPMHFLIGSSSMLQPPGEFDDKDLLLQKRWRNAQRLTDLFWQRWLREYLPTLQRRQKWHGKVPNLEIGDIVIVIDESLKRGNFPLGIVDKVFPGKDGIVRVAEVRMETGSYRRPIVKLAKLDIVEKV